MKIKRSAKILIIISTVVIVLLAIIIPTTYFVLNKSTTDIVKGPTPPVETKPTTPALPQPEQNKPPVETEKPTEPKPEQPKPVEPAPEKPSQPESPKPEESKPVEPAPETPSQPEPPKPEAPVVKPTSIELVKKIYSLSTPLFFEITPSLSLNTLYRTAGTGWAFDISKDSKTNKLTYYIATNSHVIDAPSIVKNMFKETPTAISKFGTDINNFSFFLRLALPTYQFDGQDSKDNWKDINPQDLSYFNSNKYNIHYSSNIIQYTISGDKITESVYQSDTPDPIESKLRFKVLTSAQMVKSIKASNSSLNNLKNPDFGLLSIETDITNPLNMNIFKNYKKEWIDKNLSPFSSRGLNLNEEASIGGFPGIANWKDRFPNLIATNNDGSIFVTPKFISSLNNGKIVTSEEMQVPYSAKDVPNGDYWNYVFPHLNLGGGSSGSMVMNSDGQIVGIYWGGYQEKTQFDGFVANFSKNNTIRDWKEYLKLNNPDSISWLTSI